MGRKLARLLLADPATLPAKEGQFLSRLTDAEPSLAAATRWTKEMHLLLRRKANTDIDRLLDAGERTPLSSFVAGLRRDIDAIKNALATPWTTSPVEGQISKLKMIKRTMFGRAGFQLLRARVLHAT